MTFGIIVLSLFVPSAALALFLRFSAGKLLRPRPDETVPTTWGDSAVVLPAQDRFRAPGRYGIWIEGQGSLGHLAVGEVVDASASDRAVVRTLLSVSGAPDQGSAPGRFTGQLYPGPEAVASSRWQDVILDGTSGRCPAWLVEPESAGRERWAVHVHGFGTTRVTALRSVPVADSLGMVSLIPAFRGDGEGPPLPGGSPTLGMTEWRDVDAALEYAAGHGARNVVVFAWSMGAAAVFMSASHGAHRDLITRIVAIAPVTDWGAVVRAGARRAHLPAMLGSLAVWGLGQPAIQRSFGVREHISLTELTHAADEAAERVPMLLVHSELDPLVPVDASRRFAEAHPGQVELRTTRTAGHAWEFNAEPEWFSRTIREWLARPIGGDDSPGS